MFRFEKNTVGIITFHFANNYGALLQCFALQSIIKKLDYSVLVLNYINKYHKNELMRINSIKTFLQGIFFIKRNILRRKASTNFRNKFLPISPSKDIDKMSIFSCVSYIVGSDQIWNPIMTNQDPYYFGIGLPESIPVISYAASMGGDIYSENKEWFFSNLKRVSKISVREMSAKKYIEKESTYTVDVVLDPTLLLTKTEWEKIIPVKKKKKKPYLFVYSVDNGNTDFVEIVNYVSNKFNLPVVCPANSIHREYRFNNVIETYGIFGPEIFLSFLLNAEYIVTSSFHGMALSIALQKQFLAVSPKNHASRLTDLLEKLNLSSHIISCKSELSDQLLNTSINYSAVNKKLEAEREFSINWLRSSLMNI